MKNKKNIYVVIVLAILIVIIIAIVAIKSNKPIPINHTSPDNSPLAKTIQEELKQKDSNKEYLKLKGGEFLTEDTSFSKYSFINKRTVNSNFIQ